MALSCLLGHTNDLANCPRNSQVTAAPQRINQKKEIRMQKKKPHKQYIPQ